MSTSESSSTQAAAAASLPERPEIPPWRLVVTLTVAGALAAFALSFVYEATKPAIEANKARVLESAVAEVLKAPARVVSLKVTADGLEPDPDVVYRPEKDVERVFFGYDDQGRPIGFALVGAAYGYGSDPIKLIFGYDATTDEVIGLKVLEHKETPGIGTGIEQNDAFTGQWWRPTKPGTRRKTPRQVTKDDALVAVRGDAAPSADAEVEVHEVDTISGATISSRAVIKVVNEALAKWGERLKAWRPGEAR